MWKDKGGTGLWVERVNKQTGESSIKIHEPKVVKTWCGDKQHYFELVDVGKRLCVCKKCGWEAILIVGLQELVNGKIIFKK